MKMVGTGIMMKDGACVARLQKHDGDLEQSNQTGYALGKSYSVDTPFAFGHCT